MENIYTLKGRFAEASEQYDSLVSNLNALYEEQEGECTEETEAMEAVRAEIESLKADILTDIIENSDAYAEIALNKQAQRKVLETELKAIKEEQAKVVARYTAKIAEMQRKEDWWKENFNEAMQMAEREKIGGAKTDLLHSIYYKTNRSVVVDEDTLLAPFSAAVAELTASLPVWAKPSITISKTELKKVDDLPAGAQMVETRDIVIR